MIQILLFSDVERVVSQHQRPARPRREDHPPHQQGGDGSQAHAASRETQRRLNLRLDTLICRLGAAKE